MSNVLAMPPSLLAFVLLNILGWLVHTGRGNPFLIASLCIVAFHSFYISEMADIYPSGSDEHHLLHRPSDREGMILVGAQL